MGYRLAQDIIVLPVEIISVNRTIQLIRGIADIVIPAIHISLRTWSVLINGLLVYVIYVELNAAMT